MIQQTPKSVYREERGKEDACEVCGGGTWKHLKSRARARLRLSTMRSQRRSHEKRELPVQLRTHTARCTDGYSAASCQKDAEKDSFARTCTAKKRKRETMETTGRRLASMCAAAYQSQAQFAQPDTGLACKRFGARAYRSPSVRTSLEMLRRHPLG